MCSCTQPLLTTTPFLYDLALSKDFASFATRQYRFSTLTTIFCHLEGVGSQNNTRYKKVCVDLHLTVYITRDFSLSLAIEIYGRPFFCAHPSVESTTVL